MTPVFSNRPKFCTKPLTLEETLSLPKFNVLTESSLENGSALNLGAACGDPNLGTTFIKNVIHQVIRCGGKPIDLNFFMDAFGASTHPVTTKRWFNHYICDMDMNIYAAASVTGTVAGDPLTFQILKQNHGGSGEYSLPALGYTLMDKDNMIPYTVTDVDNTTDYAHKVTIVPQDATVVASIKANKPYLIIPTRMVGGYSCQEINNKMSTIGYTQEVHPLRLRSDWEVTIDLLRGYMDKIQYAVIYDYEGNPMDSWDVYEAQLARESLRIGLNVLSFIGSPTTNQSLITGVGATIDSTHTGFYGLVPAIKFGGGVVYDYRASLGFDLEADGEPLFLYQDSLKRTSKFMVKHGLAFGFGLNNRSNKMVARTQVGATVFEAFKRMGELSGEDATTNITKMGVRSYDYMGFELDFMKWGALSDSRFVGSDYYSNLAIMIPAEGPTENGRQINPIEFYQYGQNGWTGDYYETMVDHRTAPLSCEKLSGYCAQSLAMAVHCPQLFMLLNPVVDA